MALIRGVLNYKKVTLIEVLEGHQPSWATQNRNCSGFWTNLCSLFYKKVSTN